MKEGVTYKQGERKDERKRGKIGRRKCRIIKNKVGSQESVPEERLRAKEAKY